jgi:hypothetical protein
MKKNNDTTIDKYSLALLKVIVKGIFAFGLIRHFALCKGALR